MENKIEFKEVLSENLCLTCLSDGRILHPIIGQEAVKFYLDCISEIPGNSSNSWSTPCPDVCWECKALLQKVISFKQQIQDSNRLLQAYSFKNIQDLISSDIVRPSRLTVRINQSIDVSPEIEEGVDQGGLTPVFVKNEDFKDESLSLGEDLKQEEIVCSDEDSNYLDNFLEVPCPIEEAHSTETKSEMSKSIRLDKCKMQDKVSITNVRKRGRPRRGGSRERTQNGSHSSQLREGQKKKKRDKKNIDSAVLSQVRARIECRACDKTFSHRAGLLNHTGVVHRQRDKYPCERCGKVFKWRNSLRKHAEQHDKTNKTAADQKPFCIQCDVSFASICSYKRHLRNSLKHVTQNQLKFVCDHCQKRYANKTKLRDHIEEKHLKKTFHCHICLKPSKNRVCLDQHIRNIHKGRPNNKICQYCGKGFPTKMQLESHIRAHTGERPYICEYCPTTFSQQSNLYKHYRQIHDNKIKTKIKDGLSDGLTVSLSDVCIGQEAKVLPVFQYNVNVI